MIEEIYNYFTIEMLYYWVNLGVLPFWIVLIFFPNSNLSRYFVTSIFPILILSAAYCFMLYIGFQQNYNFLDNFRLYLNLSEISNLFSNNNFLLMFWIHFLLSHLNYLGLVGR